LVRMVRMFPMFKVFWSLVQGVLDSVRMLIYTYMIITVVLYIFAIFAVYLIGKAPVFKDDELAQEYFGDVPKAMFTFFQVVTLDGWGAMCRPLMKKSGVVVPLFVAAIMVVTLALLNLVVAVICNNAFDRAKQDDDILAAQKRLSMQLEIAELEKMFVDMDSDGDSMLSKEEYDNACANDEAVIAKLSALDIHANEYGNIWELLDDGTGEASVKRFADLLRALKGQAMSKDSFSILRRIHQANLMVQSLNKKLGLQRTLAMELRTEATDVRQKLGDLQYEMVEIIQLLGMCIPSRPVDVQPHQVEAYADKLQDQVERVLR